MREGGRLQLVATCGERVASLDFQGGRLPEHVVSGPSERTTAGSMETAR